MKKRKSNRLRSLSLGALVVVVSSVGAWGVWQMTQSKLFVVKQIDVRMTGFIPERPFPVTEAEIVTLTAIRLNEDRLVNVNLTEVQERLKTQPWIKKVEIWKNFPTTLSVRVTFREPIGVIQKAKGELFYLDREGRDDLPVDSRIVSGLPLISNVSISDQPEQARSIMELLQRWNDSDLAQMTQLSGVAWTADAGLKLFANYFLERDKRWVRTRIDLGQKIDGQSQSEDALPHLAVVFRHLIRDSVAAFQIFLAGSKKIVVKTDRRS